MSNYTPGPWRFSSHPHDGNYMRITCSNDPAEGDNLRGYCGEANARLIAAAPDLLDALQTLMKVHDESAGFAGKYGRKLDEAIEAQRIKVDHATALARAALARATGSGA